MPDGLQIYSQYKTRQQRMRDTLLNLLGRQSQMQTQEQFYRTRPSELARGEEYRAGTEYRKALLIKTKEDIRNLQEARGKEEESKGLLKESKMRLLADPTLTQFQKSYLKTITTHDGLIDFVKTRQTQEYGLRKMRVEEELKLEEEPTIAEKQFELLTPKQKIISAQKKYEVKKERIPIKILEAIKERALMHFGIEENELLSLSKSDLFKFNRFVDNMATDYMKGVPLSKLGMPGTKTVSSGLIPETEPKGEWQEYLNP